MLQLDPNLIFADNNRPHEADYRFIELVVRKMNIPNDTVKDISLPRGDATYNYTINLKDGECWQLDVYLQSNYFCIDVVYKQSCQSIRYDMGNQVEKNPFITKYTRQKKSTLEVESRHYCTCAIQFLYKMLADIHLCDFSATLGTLNGSRYYLINSFNAIRAFKDIDRYFYYEKINTQ
jgi:hypothetical protein